MTDDIAAWLTAIWDEDEAESRLEKYEAWWVSEDGPFDPDRVRARIAVDRQILKFCMDTAGPDDEAIGWGGFAEVVRMLASAYADRPGYREEWKP